MFPGETTLWSESAVSSKSLFKPRIEAMCYLATFMLTSGATSAAASPALGVSNEAVIGCAITAMCLMLATQYFDDFDYGRYDTVVRLVEAGGLGALAGWAVWRSWDELTTEVMNVVPDGAWATPEGTTALVMAASGILFWMGCDAACRHGTTISRGLLAPIEWLVEPPKDLNFPLHY